MKDKIDIHEIFGGIDVYLFDQLQKGRFDNYRTVLDVGCGGGRNLVYFLQNGFDVFGIDRDENAVKRIQEMAATLAPGLSPENFRVAEVDDIPFSDDQFDVVVCCAVLHFANNEAHFEAMIKSMWRVLGDGGFLFVRLASTIGIEDKIQSIGEKRYRLPDGTTRFLVDEGMLLEITERLGGRLAEPIKTTNVQNMRCMTTWCATK